MKDNSIFTRFRRPLLDYSDNYKNIRPLNTVSFVFKEDDIPPGYDFQTMKFQDLLNNIYNMCEKDNDHAFYIEYFYLQERTFNIDAFSAFNKDELDPDFKDIKNLKHRKEMVKPYQFLNK